MTHNQKIPCNFKIPKGYKRTFLLRAGDDLMKITISHRKGLRLEQSGLTGKYNSAKLDWIQETMEKIRSEIEA